MTVITVVSEGVTSVLQGIALPMRRFLAAVRKDMIWAFGPLFYRGARMAATPMRIW
jgi:hypothetical protein